MNRKIAMSVFSITAALAIMGGATYAAFTTSATATGNTFAVGDANLQISLNGVDFNVTQEGPDFSGMFPGQQKDYLFWLKNNSSAAIDLDLIADVTAIVNADDGVDTIDNVLLVSWLCDTDGDNSLANNTPTSEFSPRDWLVGGNANLGILTPGEIMKCQLAGRIPSAADNAIAGETVQFSVEYGATQIVPSPTPVPSGF